MHDDAQVCLNANHAVKDESAAEPSAVLIVDDYQSNLVALEAVLARLPVRIVRARSGAEALARSAEEEFAVALLDWQMPGLDGVETARLMREHDPARQPPIIILTAHPPDLSEIKTAYAAGVVDFLQKPYAPEVLAGKVSVFVELHVQREKLRSYERRLRMRFEQDLVGVVSHDLRSPLGAIALAAESALEHGEMDERTRRSLQIVRSAAGRAGRLVHDLLDYTQVLHGTGFPIKREKFCMFELAQEIVDELRSAFPAAEVVVERGGATDGLWDRDRLAQAIANLVVNATTYGAGSPIKVHVGGDESALVIQVHNDGEPIPPELLPQLFEPLRRGNRRSRIGNIGLGLFIVNEVVRAHGGTVTVRSASDHGTTFTACLPRQLEGSTRPASRSVRAEPLEPQPTANPSSCKAAPV
jgi:signal transduction histidine kinase